MSDNKNIDEAFEKQEMINQKEMLKKEELKGNPGYTTDYRRKYGALSAVGGLVAFFGWVIFLIGGVATLISVFTMIKESGFTALTLGRISIMTISVTFSGLVMAGMGQSMRTMADNANNTGEILSILKRK